MYKTTPPETPPAAAEKRPYEPPRILSREPLEAVAAICRGGTSKVNTILCPRGPTSS